MKKIYKKRGLDRITETTKLARCGHPSATRYFKCENCQPELPTDTDFLYMGNESDETEVENEFNHDDEMVEIDWGCLE